MIHAIASLASADPIRGPGLPPSPTAAAKPPFAPQLHRVFDGRGTQSLGVFANAHWWEEAEIGNWALGETAPLDSKFRYQLFSLTGPEWRQAPASLRVLSNAVEGFPGFGTAPAGRVCC